MLSAMLLSGTTAISYSASSAVFYRTPGQVFDNNGSADQDGPAASIGLQIPTVFGLTSGVAIDIPLTASVPGATYRLAAPVAGISIDAATGRLTGTPTAAAGEQISLAVEAVKNAKVVATTPAIVRTLRQPIAIDVIPTGLGTLVAGQDLPTTGTVTAAQGGQPETYTWSLVNAPSWLGITSGTSGSARLSIASGKTRAMPSTQIGVQVTDGEGRVSAVSNFTMQVAQGPVKLTASDASASALFGYSSTISQDGTTAYVGQYSTAGVYVYHLTNGDWIQTHKVLPPVGDNADGFGGAVAVSGDGSRMLVAARTAKGTGTVSSGIVYAYELVGGQWVFKQRISPREAQADKYFGGTLTISGDGSTALVTTTYRGTGQGGISVLRYSSGSWTEEPNVLVGSGVAALGYFGSMSAISTNGNTFVAGAAYYNGSLQAEGRAFVFSYASGNWSQTTLQSPAGASYYQQFGKSVGISGDGTKILVGSTNSAYAFRKSGSAWTGAAVPPPASPVGFGTSIAVSSDGSKAAITTFDGPGAVHFYTSSGTAWSLSKSIVPSDTAASDSFGYGFIGISGTGSRAIVGAYTQDGVASDSGAAYLLDSQ
jgi:hypothetical protein